MLLYCIPTVVSFQLQQQWVIVLGPGVPHAIADRIADRIACKWAEQIIMMKFNKFY